MGMTDERAAQLAAAFGADQRRWPEVERGDARLDEAVLAEARTVDWLLASAPTPVASHALTQRIIDLAPLARRAGRAWTWLTRAGLGATLAGACAAGVAFGAVVVPPELVTSAIGAPAPDPTDEASAALETPYVGDAR